MAATGEVTATEKRNLHPTSYTTQYTPTGTEKSSALHENIHNFGGKKVKKSRPKKTIISPERNREIHLADKFEQHLTSNFGIERDDEAAEIYYQKYPTVAAKANRYWPWVEQARDSHAGFHTGDRTFRKMFDQFVDPYFYTLALDDLPITPKIERMLRTESIFNPQVDLANIRQVHRNSKILAALLREHLPRGALLWKIESNLEVPHLHAVAEGNAGLLHLPRLEAKQSGKCSPVWDEQGLMTYLLKPVFSIRHDRPFNREEAVSKLALVIAAKRDFYQPHPEVITQYREQFPDKKIPSWVYKRSLASTKLPNMRDFYPAKQGAYA